jgi:hypothetical protein
MRGKTFVQRITSKSALLRDPRPTHPMYASKAPGKRVAKVPRQLKIARAKKKVDERRGRPYNVPPLAARAVEQASVVQLDVSAEDADESGSSVSANAATVNNNAELIKNAVSVLRFIDSYRLRVF